MSDIKIAYELRPCYVVSPDLKRHVKALFHGWVTTDDTLHGILEFEDGSIGTAPSYSFVFADDAMDQYVFKPFEQLRGICETKKGELLNDKN